MNKKILAAVGGLAVLALFGAFFGAKITRADDNGNANGQSSDGANHGAAVSQVARAVSVGEAEQNGLGGSMNESASLKADGSFTVTGVKVNAVDAASNSATVTLYGFTHTVNLSGAAITGGGRMITLADIQPGDTLSGSGTFDEATHAITVSSVNDLSYASQNTANIQAQIQQLLQLLQKLQAQVQVQQGQGAGQ